MARERSRRVEDRLSTPGRERSLFPSLKMDSDTFGVFAERFARFMGTARFLIWMTVFIAIWVAWNVLAPRSLRFDEFPFIFLTLALSLQASYAAPLILLAQNRQEARDRIQAEDDRKQAAQSRADMDFLARELASVRMNVGELATRDFIRSELRGTLEEGAKEVRPTRTQGLSAAIPGPASADAHGRADGAYTRPSCVRSRPTPPRARCCSRSPTPSRP